MDLALVEKDQNFHVHEISTSFHSRIKPKYESKRCNFICNVFNTVTFFKSSRLATLYINIALV